MWFSNLVLLSLTQLLFLLDFTPTALTNLCSFWGKFHHSWAAKLSSPFTKLCLLWYWNRAQWQSQTWTPTLGSPSCTRPWARSDSHFLLPCNEQWQYHRLIHILKHWEICRLIYISKYVRDFLLVTILVTCTAARGKCAGRFRILRPEWNIISELLQSISHQISSCYSSPGSLQVTSPGSLLAHSQASTSEEKLDCMSIWVLLRRADICTVSDGEPFLE